MNKERERKLFDAVTYVKEELIEETQDFLDKKEGKKFKWRTWKLVAASLFLVLSLGSFAIWQNYLPFGGSRSPGSGSSGYDGDLLDFMSYAGPVLPLSLDKTSESIKAERSIIYDFPFEKEESIRVRGSQIKDQYTLTNTSKEDIEVNIIYPFVSNYNELHKDIPTLFIDDKKIEANIYPGSYKGNFMEKNSKESDIDLGLARVNNWKDFKKILEDGTYIDNAFSAYPDLNQKVIVYEFTDFIAPLDQYKAASQAISFKIDSNKTNILHCGFNGMKWNDDGLREYSYFVPNPEHENKIDNVKMLIIFGEDIGEYELEGYKDGGTEKGNELEGVSVKISRYEDILSHVIEKTLNQDYFKQDENNLLELIEKEMFLGSLTEFFYYHNILGHEITDWHASEGLMEIASEVKVMDRVFYLEYPIKIASGESLSILADFYKKPSFDFSGAKTKKQGIQGYDLATKLDSNLNINSLEAEIRNIKNIEIVNQNFGFDISKDLTKVNLDPSVDYYYLEIRPVEKKK